MQQPGMAQQMINLQTAAAKATPEQREKMAALKSDPELKLIFDDIEQNGPGESFACIISTTTITIVVVISSFFLLHR